MCVCVCVEMAKSGQQLMAFPCIQMRKFDGREGGHVWIAEVEGIWIICCRMHPSCRKEGRESLVTSVESKDEMAASNVDVMRINQNYRIKPFRCKEVTGPPIQGDSGSNPKASCRMAV